MYSLSSATYCKFTFHAIRVTWLLTSGRSGAHPYPGKSDYGIEQLTFCISCTRTANNHSLPTIIMHAKCIIKYGLQHARRVVFWTCWRLAEHEVKCGYQHGKVDRSSESKMRFGTSHCSSATVCSTILGTGHLVFRDEYPLAYV